MQEHVVIPQVAVAGIRGAAVDQASATGLLAAWEVLHSSSIREAGSPRGIVWVAVRRAVLGEAMGGQLRNTAVQKALARYGTPAGVLMAPVPAHPGVASLLSIARQHPTEALAVIAGRSLRLRPEYLFEQLSPVEAERQARRYRSAA